jgi:hypothetical protein
MRPSFALLNVPRLGIVSGAALVALASVTSLASLASLSGCAAFRRLAGTDIVSLEKSDIKSMTVGLRRGTPTICPREPVQMAVSVDATLDGDKGLTRVETWQGRGSVNKNDKLEFSEFAFRSSMGRFDNEGWFLPNPDMVATAGKEFDITTTYRRRPEKFTFPAAYKPDYSCVHSAGRKGPSGSPGRSGDYGNAGTNGRDGSDNAAGGAGGSGGTGGAGMPGSDGVNGPNLAVFATLVRTPFYERLVGLVIQGDIEDFLLVPVGQPLTIQAAGGAGGAGGDGGQGGAGGAGGRGGRGGPGGAGGSGGPGGSGGHGGQGGHGGKVDFLYDARFPELREQIRIDVSGGTAGAGGSAGRGGTAGSGGRGGGSATVNAAVPSDGPSGAGGSGGNAGAPGRPGRHGKASVMPEEVRDVFANKGVITPL